MRTHAPDELALVGRTRDDKDACTVDWCDAAGGCKHAAIDGCKP